MTRLIVLLRTVAITLVLGAAWLAPAAAEESAKTRPERGHDLYRVYCINCHGVEARGDGPIAELLRVKPADLTAIARENDGAFPAYAVYRQIDGRTQIAAHGSREMPIWGLSFQDPHRDSDQEGEIRERILDLVAFIESIQEKKTEAKENGAEENE